MWSNVLLFNTGLWTLLALAYSREEKKVIFHLIFLNFLKSRTHVDPVRDSNMVNAKIVASSVQICLAVSSYSGINAWTATWKFKSEFTTVLSQKKVACAKQKRVETVVRLPLPAVPFDFWMEVKNGAYIFVLIKELESFSCSILHN